MVYFDNSIILVRDMAQADAQIITDEEIAQGWNQSVDKYRMRLQHQAEGKAHALVAEYMGNVAGYIHIYKEVTGGPFAGTGYPEIVDFGVLEKYRRKGIGKILMDVAEQIAGQCAHTVCLGVGLHSGYGSAQRMYIKRGFVPDGSGVWYQDRQCIQYETACTVDDDLILYLSKKLPGARPPRKEQSTGNVRQAAAGDSPRTADSL